MTNEAPPSTQGVLRRLNATFRRQVLPVLARVPQYGRLVYLLATDATLTRRDKTPLYLALGYQLSPIEVIPGFIPVLGQLDDVLAMLWGIQRVLDAIPPERAAEHLATVNLTRMQISADAELVHGILTNIAKKSARAIGTGLLAVLTTTVTAGAYVGYLVYFALKDRDVQRQR